ncbi:fibroblast growth factor receptor substrate 2 isoform X1 [Salmo trutta]|nr:fibroblast growth factor receptor substrate 2-like isoform X1 [Salmo trutta]XP_029615029.1 fibroblast growth factor receptor substrate 2-like isoform X1 [Salmo trutta]
MGSCLSCPEKESIPDNHQTKFKVINVDDDGNELGSGVMELTEAELVLHTHRRDDVRWPYMCLRRYGYDSNLFSFESGHRCKTGPGIFAFKCARAEEIFNMLQEVMHSHSISVVEEAVLEANHQTALGYSVPTVPNGVTRTPSVGDTPSHPSTRHPSVASTRLPSVGEESSHPLLVADDAIHTYVNTTGLLDDQPSPLTVPAPLDSPDSGQSQCPPTPPPPRVARPEPLPPMPQLQEEPQVLLEPLGVRFVLGPTPVQKKMAKGKQSTGGGDGEEAGEDPESPDLGKGETNSHTDTHCATEAPALLEGQPQPPHTHSNGTSVEVTAPITAPRLHRTPPDTLQNVNNSAQRRTALLDYENLPALPPVWETRKPSNEEVENNGGGQGGLKTPSLNGYNHHHSLLHHSYSHPLSAYPPLSAMEPSHNYVNTENVTAPLSARCAPDMVRRRTDGPTIFNFDFRRPLGLLCQEPPKTLNYIEVEMESTTTSSSAAAKGASSDTSNPHTPRTPTSPLPPTTPTRRTELYAFIDIERTAAMSSLQKARPRDDGTSRKTRHNSTELPTKSTV